MSIYENMSEVGTHFSFGDGDKPDYIRAVLCGFDKVQLAAKNCYWDDYRILLLFEGEGDYEDDFGNHFSLNPGVLLQRLPFHNHSLYRSKDKTWYEFALVISEGLYNHFLGLGIIDKNRLLYESRDLSTAKHKVLSFMQVLRSCKESGNSNKAIVESINFLYQLFSMDKVQSEAEQKINKACQLLSENLAHSPPMAEIARCVGMGYHSFRKQFKELRGVSPKEFLLRARIDRAVELMSLSNMSLGEVAFELGYPDFATFAKQFKKRMGISPGKFRA